MIWFFHNETKKKQRRKQNKGEGFFHLKEANESKVNLSSPKGNIIIKLSA